MHPQSHSAKRLITGFILALALTLIPFAAVWTMAFPVELTFGIIALCALVQVGVHLHYFLGIDSRTPIENVLAMSFAGVLIFLMVGGTLWIMFDLYERMM
ncbi:cytochrome bo3 quinol oxidase subunit 4 [Pseudovibrio denitrificans]|uniref:Cytochrome bo(3) ubiquinol oxidase subunit 4 n=2 Tax=Pseudovibrio TaxID=258255 RepID=A0A1I7D4B3_9HYPH|nr:MULTISPECIES: cytochrome o ubiquinol oxidase subunit IV [Pseudovibrio]EEA93235.1 cytochrome o ubiquinol oxidase subunit IV [Pseudovibrio sp. JE062]QUS58733.1 cytochrome o ubiquinol oxidase subunit IV [Pseudovibrio brasiliensis]WNZ53729.1 cytochrome o ubiquinol oxidase subunit IV [Microbulbifer sp. MKSA007]SFU06471.1 cytochrome bo3 quinol oxidase subunit 4 [Pseudovibrio denitrificans]